MTTWRDRFRPLIAKTLAALPPEATEKECRAELREKAWPKNHPRVTSWTYKVWLSEVRIQLELRGADVDLRVYNRELRRQIARRQKQRRKLPAGRKLPSMTAEQKREWMRDRQIPMFGGDQ